MSEPLSTIPFALAMFAHLSSEKLSEHEAKLLYENLWDLYARTEPLPEPPERPPT
jgi:hypothetical protein